MKKFGVRIDFIVSFDERSEAYDLIENFRAFLDEHVSPENFDDHNIQLVYRCDERNLWGDRKY